MASTKNVKEVQQFMGLCNYYRRFVRNFSEIACPLTKLTGKGVNFDWTEQYEQVFTTLKQSLLCWRIHDQKVYLYLIQMHPMLALAPHYPNFKMVKKE